MIMPTRYLTLIPVVASLLLMACSDKNDKQETLIDPQIKALEKAQGVEQVLQQSDEARRKQLEEMQK
jgi:outer membrane PBP1 activator LpoA protein